MSTVHELARQFAPHEPTLRNTRLLTVHEQDAINGHVPKCDRLVELILAGEVEDRSYSAAEIAGIVDRFSGPAPAEIEPITDLYDRHPQLHEPVIGGLLRRGETGNLIASTKVGKSWLENGLALSMAMGVDWLGMFPCKRGRVLIIDNELHAATLAFRLKTVAEAMGLRPQEYADSIDILSLRGRLMDLNAIVRRLDSVEPGSYDLVILDAWYRAIPNGTSENENSSIALLYNLIDRAAERLESAWLNVHHSSKGSQGEKSVTDVGSGAGAQSRAADCHIVLRAHQEPDAACFEAKVRSFAPPAPVVLTWQFPLWKPTAELDPAKLATANDTVQRARDDEGKDVIREAIREAGGLTASGIRRATGLGMDRVKRLAAELVSAGEAWVSVETVAGNECQKFNLAGVKTSFE